MALEIRTQGIYKSNPSKPVVVARVSLHLEDKNGLDRGALGEVRIETISGKQ
jgi:hypothetical protein